MSWQPLAAFTIPRRLRAFTSVTAMVLRLAQEAPRALRIAVTAPDRMSLPLQQLCEKRAGRSGP